MTQSSASTIAQVIDTFIRQVDSLRDTLPTAMIAVQRSHRAAHRAYDEFVASSCHKTERDGKVVLAIPYHSISKYEELESELSKSNEAYDIVARSFLVSIVSQYDAFLGRLVRALFVYKPELLNASEKSLNFSDLVAINTIEEAREQIIEFEVEGLLRKSHKDQFIWLEARFDIELRKNLPVWPRFIELTQRRNIFVHCDGIVSKQYLRKCKEDHVKHDHEIKVGDELSLDLEYFEQTRDALFEIGLKLAQVLWRKVNPKSISEADNHLNACAYDLIKKGEYRLATTLLDFSCEVLKTHADDKTKRMLIVNRANAYKLSGDIAKSAEIMAKVDWTAASDTFQLAAAALKDDVESVAKIMIKIGKSDEMIGPRGYREWPLFLPIRALKPFKAAFRKVFKEPLDLKEVVVEENVERSHSGDVHESNKEEHKRSSSTKKKSVVTVH